jgi:CheY-like chemotaxis protein
MVSLVCATGTISGTKCVVPGTTATVLCMRKLRYTSITNVVKTLDVWNFVAKCCVDLVLRPICVPIMLRHSQERSVGSEVPSRPLIGPAPRILIVEDELLIALMLAEMLRESGYRVSGTAHTLVLARQELAKRNFDAVLLDVIFDGRPRPEIADLLVERAVPFAFITGYDYVVEPRHENVPVLQKPFTFAQFRVLLRDLVGPGLSSGETAQSA